MSRPFSRATLWRVVASFVLVLLLSTAAWARPSVAVVLGGGAARGFSHIGLLKAFEEEGIPIDMLVGTSMGSVVAGLYAAGVSPDELEWMVQQIDLSELFSPIIPPRGGFLDTAGFQRFLDALTGEALIEDLEVPFYSVVTNLVTGESVALDQGPLSTAIVASMSIPGMFPPVTIDGAVYIDGGIKEPVPVVAARQAGADVVVAVDVRRELEEIDHDAILTNLQLTLYFLLDDNTEEQLVEADVIISPDVHTSSYMEYTEGASFIEEGYEAAINAIPEIKALLMERDPTIRFQPRLERGVVVDEGFRRRFEQAVAAARPAATKPRFRSSTALAFESGEAPRLDFGIRVGLGSGQSGTFEGVYDHSRRFGMKSTHTLGVGVGWGDLYGSVFGRKIPDEAGFSPGASVRARFGGGTGARLAVDGEWVKRGDSGGEATIDVAGEWSFPLRRGGVWEVALLEPAFYIGVGLGADLAEEALVGRVRVEGGYDFDVRLFGIYPLRARLSLAYRGGNSPWALTLRFGE